MAAALQQPFEAVELPAWQITLDSLRHEVIAPDQRLYWMIELRERLFPTDRQAAAVDLSDGALVDTMIELGARLCDWPLVIYLCSARDTEQDSQYNQQHLTRAFFRQGMLHQALGNLRGMMLQDHRDTQLFEDYRHLDHAIGQIPYRLETLKSDELSLVPMMDCHCDDFAWVYDDPTIAQRCNLPEFRSKHEWFSWLNMNREEQGRSLFALYHETWGFIGSVCLEVFDGVGFFYYWLGADFQGQGFGGRALELLLEVGVNYHQMYCCYAKVYTDNTPSQKAMEKVGFGRLPFRAHAPYDDEYFYYWGDAIELGKAFDQLSWLFEVQDNNMTLQNPFE